MANLRVSISARLCDDGSADEGWASDRLFLTGFLMLGCKVFARFIKLSYNARLTDTASVAGTNGGQLSW